MARSLELALQRIGLDGREASVYLAALELGPSPVQKIAQRADVPRATTYLVLDDLRNKGFVTTYDEGKKTFFVAESPERLAMLVNEREAEVKRQKEAVKKLVPELLSRGQFEKGERPVVRYYEGPKAVQSFVRDGLAGRGGEILSFSHLDKAIATLEQVGYPIEKVRQRRARHRIKSRIIYTTKGGALEGYSTRDRQAKYVDERLFPFEADVIVRGDWVTFVPYGAPLRGVSIVDRAIARTMRQIFEILWQKI